MELLSVLRGSLLSAAQVPKAWREELAAEGTRSGRSRVHQEVRAADGTRKFLLQLADGHVVETVGIPLDNNDKHSLTCCVSSQARTVKSQSAPLGFMSGCLHAWPVCAIRCP